MQTHAGGVPTYARPPTVGVQHCCAPARQPFKKPTSLTATALTFKCGAQLTRAEPALQGQRKKKSRSEERLSSLRSRLPGTPYGTTLEMRVDQLANCVRVFPQRKLVAR